MSYSEQYQFKVDGQTPVPKKELKSFAFQHRDCRLKLEDGDLYIKERDEFSRMDLPELVRLEDLPEHVQKMNLKRFSFPSRDCELKLENGTLYVKERERFIRFNLPDLVEREDIPETVPYEDSVDVNLTVDTDPFDSSVNKCCNKVNELSGEVCNLTTATISSTAGITAAKAGAASKIAHSLTSGFSRYVHYLIQEKMVKLRAEIPNIASTFSALGNNLSQRQQVLQQDFERITSRYSKIILQLAETLEARLKDLDRPAYETCAMMQEDIFTAPFGTMLGQSVCSGNEQLETANHVRVTHLKDNTLHALNEIAQYITNLRVMRKQLKSCLTDHHIESFSSINMPVIRAEFDDLDSSESLCTQRVVVPEYFAEVYTSERIDKVKQELAAKNLQPKTEKEVALIDKKFHDLTSGIATDPSDSKQKRIITQMLELWNKTKENMTN